LCGVSIIFNWRGSDQLKNGTALAPTSDGTETGDPAALDDSGRECLEIRELALNYSVDDPCIWLRKADNTLAKFTPGGASVVVSATPPTDAREGDLWFDSTEGRTYLWYVDSDGGQWVPVTPEGGGGTSVTTGELPPETPANGDLWYDTTSGRTYLWYVDSDSGQWVPVTPEGGGGASVTVSELPPEAPAQGDLWFASAEGRTYLWYVDSDGGQWVPVTPEGGGSGGASVTVSELPPADPAQGDLWYASAEGRTYLWYIDSDGGQWVPTTPEGGGGGGASVTVSDTPPLNPAQGDLWYASMEGRTYLWYIDSDGGQWVPTTPEGGGGDTSHDEGAYGITADSRVLCSAGGSP
jgi:hypothetical protein